LRREFRAGHIARHSHRIGARALNLRSSFVGWFRVNVREHDAGAVRGKQFSTGATNAARRAGDDGYFPFQQMHEFVSFQTSCL